MSRALSGVLSFFFCQFVLSKFREETNLSNLYFSALYGYVRLVTQADVESFPTDCGALSTSLKANRLVR